MAKCKYQISESYICTTILFQSSITVLKQNNCLYICTSKAFCFQHRNNLTSLQDAL